MTLTADKGFLPASTETGQWHIDEGSYKVAIGKAADDLVLAAKFDLEEAVFDS